MLKYIAILSSIWFLIGWGDNTIKTNIICNNDYLVIESSANNMVAVIPIHRFSTKGFTIVDGDNNRAEVFYNYSQRAYYTSILINKEDKNNILNCLGKK